MLFLSVNILSVLFFEAQKRGISYYFIYATFTQIHIGTSHTSLTSICNLFSPVLQFYKVFQHFSQTFEKFIQFF